MNKPRKDRAETTRREFLWRLAAASVAAGSASAATGYLAAKPQHHGKADGLPRFGDYSSKAAPSDLAMAEMPDHAAAVRTAL
ncbi:MAG: hypothetical protein ISS69_18845, partial [Phycisphaerae bacterium]|nr:hypothetical protein [Phycisphaerae bacterium]